MANFNSSTTTSANATAQQALHQKFSWFDPLVNPEGEAKFLGQVYDICEGAKTVLEIVQKDAMDVQRHDTPIFDAQATERLVLFTTAALSMLGDITFERIEAVNNAVVRPAQ